MNKTRKVFIAVLTMCILVCLGLFTFSACSKTEEVKLSKITITTPPTKITYISGETFDPAGVVITATYTDESTKDVTELVTYDEPSLKVDAGKFEASVTVKFTYTENDISKTINQTVKVTNKITSATITTMPTKTEYFVGNTFSPAGMVISAKLEDGTSQSIDVTKNNATFSVSGALTKDVKEIVVTIGGYELKVPVTILNTIYVEAETGYRNGSLIDQSTGDSGNLRVDAFTTTVQNSVKNLYTGHLKALFAVAQMEAADESFDAEALAAERATADDLYEVFGGTKSVYNPNVTAGGEIVSKLYTETVKWLKDEANKEAIDAYLASDEYKDALAAYVAGTNEDIADWNYAADVAHYVAHPDDNGNEYYLGQNNPGDTISFLFDSSKATTGTIAFRLSSAYLYADSSWISIVMGDIQFNKFAEFYVNGVKQEISDDVVLLGGKTEDGSADNILWANWDTVEFTNVPFVEGRNVIELKILNHGIAAQESYTFAANIDTLLVAPNDVDGAELDMYDASKTITATATSVKIAENSGKAVVTVEGTYTGISSGYVGDLLSVTVGGASSSVTANGGKFTATVDVTGYEVGNYAINFNGSALKIAISADSTLTVGGNYYKLVADETSGAVVLNVDSDVKVVLNSASIRPEVTEDDFNIVVDGDKVYIVLSVGIYEAEIVGYDLTKADDVAAVKASLESKIKELFYFDMQRNATWDYPLGDNFETISVNLDDNTFTVYADVTNYPAHGDGSTHGGMVHFILNADSASTKDYKPGIVFSKTVEFNDKVYEYACLEGSAEQTNCWNLTYVAVTENNAKRLSINPVSLEFDAENNKVYYVITGTSANYTKEEIEALAFDFENGSSNEKTNETATVTLNADGTFTVKLDITEKEAAPYWVHFAVGVISDNGDVTSVADGNKIECGNKVYEIKAYTFSWGSAVVLVIENAE